MVLRAGFRVEVEASMDVQVEDLEFGITYVFKVNLRFSFPLYRFIIKHHQFNEPDCVEIVALHRERGINMLLGIRVVNKEGVCFTKFNLTTARNTRGNIIKNRRAQLVSPNKYPIYSLNLFAI